MVWTKLDDGFADNPKLIEAMDAFGDSALALWVCGVAHCNKHLTDGFIKRAVVARLTRHPSPYDVAAALVAAGCWTVTENGYAIHDFLDHNPSREEVLAAREATRRRQSTSREKRAHNAVTDARVTPAVTPVVTSPVTRDSAVTHGPVTDQSHCPLLSSPIRSDPEDLRSQPTVAPRAHAHEDPSPDEPVSTAPASGAFVLSPLDPEPPKAEPKRQRRSAIRDDFAPSEANREFAVKRGFSAEALERERLRFVNYWKSRGEPRADWSAGFRNWLDRAEPSGGGPSGYRASGHAPVNAMQNTGLASGIKLATPETGL